MRPEIEIKSFCRLQHDLGLLRGDPECRRTIEQEAQPGVADRPPDRERAGDAGDGDDQRDQANIRNNAGL